MKTSLKGRYKNDESTAFITVAVNAGDVKLLASMSDANIIRGPRLNNLTFTIEKPGSFIIDYDVPNKDFRFQFMNSIRVGEKPLKLTYNHDHGGHRTVMDGALVLDPANKVSASYIFGTRNVKVKYSYVHGGDSTYEPCYDLGNNVWDFSVSKRLCDDVFKGTYQSWTRDFALEWSRNSKFNGKFKISATVNLAGESKVPKIFAESTWDLDM
ncbi:Outer envelope pore protein 24 [Hibiscus syriacus]|uniref:Outer envelope pore protein 24 n=2 Tax=Hibiscus syriacus TaxID=106335 RepID=A0A6A3BHC0_HIBSY|nr:Outer envelope pore protein 24 [Hibiscus syriacus]